MPLIIQQPNRVESLKCSLDTLEWRAKRATNVNADNVKRLGVHRESLFAHGKMQPLRLGMAMEACPQCGCFKSGLASQCLISRSKSFYAPDDDAWFSSTQSPIFEAHVCEPSSSAKESLMYVRACVSPAVALQRAISLSPARYVRCGDDTMTMQEGSG